MAVYYLDTSALVKRYAQEPGTAWVLSPTDVAAEHDLYTVRVTGPEMMGLPPLTFVSADSQQREAATVEGFAVEDPNKHG